MARLININVRQYAVYIEVSLYLYLNTASLAPNVKK